MKKNKSSLLKSAYPIAACVGYVDGVLQGKKGGSLNKEVIEEAILFDILACTIEDNEGEDQKKITDALNVYLEAREKRDEKMKAFSMQRVAEIKDKMDKESSQEVETMGKKDEDVK